MLIVDDEPLAREGVRDLLAGDPDVAEIGEARGGDEAIALLRAQAWDLVFLDVQMPQVDGFAVVSAVGAARMPAVVFITAHDGFAIRAFEVNAVDYLQKPVTRERFARALARAKERRSASRADTVQREIVGLLETLAAPSAAVKRLAVRSGARTIFVDTAAIDWIKAAENYVEIHAGAASHLLQVTMATLEAALDRSAFVRIHRSIIIAIARIAEIEPAAQGEYVITLATGDRVRSGRTYADRVRQLMTNPF